MKSADALDAIWEAGLGEFQPNACDGAAERVEGVVRRRRVRRNRARAVSAVAALVVVAALAMLAGDNSSGRVGVSSTDPSSSTTIARTGSRRVTTPSVSVPVSVEIGDPGGTSPAEPSRTATEPVTVGPAPVIGTGRGGGTPPESAPPSDPVQSKPPHDGPPTKPVQNDDVTYVIDDNGLRSSQAAREAGSVKVKFVDERSDQSTPVALRSDPQGVFVTPGNTTAFDMRELRAFNMYAVHGARRMSNVVPLAIVEPTLAAPQEPADQLTVDIKGGEIVVPYREVRFGEPIPREGARSVIPHHWTEVGPATVTLRVRNLDGRIANLRFEHGEIMHLSPLDPDQTMTIHLDTPSLAYTLRVKGDGLELEFVLWRSAAR